MYFQTRNYHTQKFSKFFIFDTQIEKCLKFNRKEKSFDLVKFGLRYGFSKKMWGVSRRSLHFIINLLHFVASKKCSK